MTIIDIISAPVALAGGLLVYGPVLLYLWLQARALVVWRGWWMLPALPPLPVLVWVAVVTVEAYRAESNLWPIVMILTAPAGVVWLGFWALLRARFAS